MANIYSNNFDAETTGALPSGWANKVGTWAVGTLNPVSGTKTLASSSNGDGDVVLYTGAATVADMQIDTKQIQSTNAGSRPLIGHVLRSDAANSNHYAIVFSSFNGTIGNILIFKKVGGSYSQVSSTAISLTQTLGDTIYVRSKIVGGTISVFVGNGSLPATASATSTDNSVTAAGYPGIYNGKDSQAVTMAFDDFSFDEITSGAPVLSSPTGTGTGATTASGSVSTNTANGTLYRLASTNATETSATIKAALSQTVTATGVQSVTFTGLAAGTTYYAHYIHTNASAADSAVANSASFTTSATAATAVTLTGPTSGTSGSASSAFTVGANGAITGSVTVTPSDSGSGGTFTPTSVSISSGAPTGTFTYTASSAGVKTISAANNGGLTNPSNITYTASTSPVSVQVTDTNWRFSPYNWDTNGSTKIAVNGGAYFKLGFTGTRVSIGLNVASLVAASVSASWYPSLRYSVDNGPQTDVQLTSSTTALTVSGLASGTHTIEVFYLSGWWENIGGTAPDRWSTPDYCIKVTGATIDSGASTAAPTTEAGNLVWFGDSISEGIRANYGTTQPGCQNGYESVPVFAARALGCELGNVSFGGQSYVGGFNSIPAFNSAYGLFSAGRSRLSAGLFSPAPDYVCIWHGANTGSTSGSVQTAIGNMRAAAPSARICVIVPVGGFDRTPIVAGFAAYLAANTSERKVHLVDLGTSWQVGLDGIGSASQQAIDSLHPRSNWNARIGAAYAKKIAALAATTTASRTITITLTTDGTTPAASLSGLKWSLWDAPTPDAMSTPPSDYGTAATTNASGVMTLTVRTSLTSGGVGWLTVSNSDGTTTQSGGHKAFSGPVTVA